MGGVEGVTSEKAVATLCRQRAGSPDTGSYGEGLWVLIGADLFCESVGCWISLYMPELWHRLLERRSHRVFREDGIMHYHGTVLNGCHDHCAVSQMGKGDLTHTIPPKPSFLKDFHPCAKNMT